jgi:uncharacterized protein YhdP
MKSLFFSLLRLVVVFLSSSIVFFALLVALAHSLTPYFTHHVRSIERFAVAILHRPVQISRFSIAWQGLMPVLQGKQVIVWNNARTDPVFKIEQLDIGVDLLKTLLTGELKLGNVKVSGMHLTVQQTKANQFLVSGFSKLFDQDSHDTAKGINAVLAWLLAEPRLSLQNVSLIYLPVSGPKWPAMQLNAVLENTQDRHQLSVKLLFLEKEQTNLTIIANMAGSLASQAIFPVLKGTVYVQGQSILLDRWLVLLGKKYTTQNAVADFKIWADWQNNHFVQLHALMASEANSILQFGKQPPVTIMPFSTDIEWQATDKGSWFAKAIIKNFGFLPWKKLPGMKGLNAYCYVTPTAGELITYAKNLVLDFTKLFKAPLHLDKLNSELTWQHQEGETLIRMPKFEAFNTDVTVNGKMGLFFPANHNSPEISLLAHVKTEHPSRIAYYLPLPFVGTELVQWLNTAIVKGSGDGSVLLHGPIYEFPFDKNEGSFLIDTQIKNGELHYESAWPNLQKINGELSFSGRHMQLLANSAEMFGTPLENIGATIPLIKSHVQAVLHIMPTIITTRLEHGLAFLEATPLTKAMGGQLSGLLVNGPLKLVLQLIIPLEAGKEKVQVLGQGSTENASVKIPSQAIQIDDLKGQFTLSQAGIAAKNLVGLLWNKPISIGIRATPTIQLAINYNGIQTILNPEKSGWRFLVDNKTAQGNLFISHNKEQAIEANFDFIHFNSASSAQTTWNLKQLPKLNLYAKDVRYNDMDFGVVQLKLRPLLAGTLIRELQAGNSSYHLIASGAWHRQGSKLTELIGQLDSTDLSGFLRSLGLPSSITAEQAHIRFNLQYPGMINAINLSQLRGNFSFNATQGQIVDVGTSAEAKISFGRLLTFLSLQSLGKRLQLDFSDLKGKGFDFTRLQGHFTINAGNAFTRDVVIEGPVAAIALTGRIGLQAKDYDLTIKVVPHFTSSLPVLVGLAGGPIAGAITWLANAVLGSTVQKIAETSYHITGSWSKPEVVKTSS